MVFMPSSYTTAYFWTEGTLERAEEIIIAGVTPLNIKWMEDFWVTLTQGLPRDATHPSMQLQITKHSIQLMANAQAKITGDGGIHLLEA